MLTLSGGRREVPRRMLAQPVRSGFFSGEQVTNVYNTSLFVQLQLQLQAHPVCQLQRLCSTWENALTNGLPTAARCKAPVITRDGPTGIEA